MYVYDENSIKEREIAIEDLSRQYTDTKWIYIVSINRHDVLGNDYTGICGVYSDKDEASKAMMWRYNQEVNRNLIYQEIINKERKGTIMQGKYDIHIEDTKVNGLSNGISIFVSIYSVSDKFIDPSTFDTHTSD